MGFSVGRRLEGKRIKHSTADSLCFSFSWTVSEPPVELISRSTEGTQDKVPVMAAFGCFKKNGLRASLDLNCFIMLIHYHF